MGVLIFSQGVYWERKSEKIKAFVRIFSPAKGIHYHDEGPWDFMFSERGRIAEFEGAKSIPQISY